MTRSSYQIYKGPIKAHENEQMSSARLQAIRATYKSKLHFYILAVNNQKLSLKSNTLHDTIKDMEYLGTDLTTCKILAFENPMDRGACALNTTKHC